MEGSTSGTRSTNQSKAKSGKGRKGQEFREPGPPPTTPMRPRPSPTPPTGRPARGWNGRVPRHLDGGLEAHRTRTNVHHVLLLLQHKTDLTRDAVHLFVFRTAPDFNYMAMLLQSGTGAPSRPAVAPRKGRGPTYIREAGPSRHGPPISPETSGLHGTRIRDLGKSGVQS